MSRDLWPARIGVGALGGVLGAACVLALGVGVTPAETGPSIPVDQAPAEAEPAASVPCARRMQVVEAELERGAGRLEELRLTERLLRGQLGPMGGLPSAWPEQVEERWREGAVRASLESATSELEAVGLLELDCSEYPCIAVARTGDYDGGWVADLVAAAGLESKYYAMAPAIGDRSVKLAAVVIGPVPTDDEVGERSAVRASRLLDAARDAYPEPGGDDAD